MARSEGNGQPIPVSLRPATRHRRVPRTLHPIAWWIWALGLAVAVNRTTNPLLLLLALAVLGFVVANRRTDAPWARAFKYYLGLALVVDRRSGSCSGRSSAPGSAPPTTSCSACRTSRRRAGTPASRIGGPVSLEATLSAAVDGLRLGTLICCIGAANALANPKRALRVLPGALYELGMAVVVAISVAPQLVESVQRVARARRLRAGQSKRRSGRCAASRSRSSRTRSNARCCSPAAMDSRGYGRTGTATRGSRRLTGALMLVGMLGPVRRRLRPARRHRAALPRAARDPARGGAVLRGAGARRPPRHPHPLPARSVASGRVDRRRLRGRRPRSCSTSARATNAAALNPTFYPLQFPPLPCVPAIAILLAAIAGVRRAAAPQRRNRPPAADRSPADGADQNRPVSRTAGAGVIEFDRVTITYAERRAPVLRDVNLHIDEGELCLVVGRTGVGQVDAARRHQRPGARTSPAARSRDA